MPPVNRRVFRLRGVKLLIALVAFGAYGVVGWSLLRFEGLPRRIANGAAYTAGGGIRFPSPGLAKTPGSPPWLAEVIRSGALELEVEAKAFAARQSGPARILSLSLNTSLRNLTLAQEGPDLIVRLRTPKTSLNGEPPYVLRGVFSNDQWRRIGVVIKGESLSLSLEGETVRSEPLPPSPLSTWDSRCRLILGNEAGGQRPWLGEIRRAAVRVGATRIDYALPGMLEIPARYWALGASASKASGPGIARQRAIRDAVINLFGFVPLGILIVFLWRRLPLVLVTLLAFVLSLFIEAGQLMVPGHFPSLTDLALNTLGGAAGGWLGKLLFGPGSRARPTPGTLRERGM